jgi:ribosomal-protein-alanine N-acetyltransferase
MLLPFRNAAWRDVRLERGRVVLRPPRGADWVDWVALRRESRDFLEPWEPTWSNDALTRPAFRRRLQGHRSEWQRGSGYAFLIRRREDGALMGGVTLSNVRRGVAQSGSLGYWIGRRFARQGYMTESLALVLTFAFENLGLHRVEGACLPSNEASRGLLTKSGFTEEGYLRRYLRIDGQWRDHVLFGILKSDPRHRI